MIGYVYIMVNAAFPDLIKIGRTTKSSNERASELYTTGTPGKFFVAYDVLVDDCIDVERQMHELIGDKRYSSNREFFQVTIKEAIEVLQEITKNRKIEEGDEAGLNLNYSSLFDGDLSRYYLYASFIGNPNSSSYHAHMCGNESNVYRFGFYLVDQVDANGDFCDCDVTPSMKFDLKSDLINYYNSFEVFSCTGESVNFVESGASTLFAEIDYPLLSKSAKLNLEKILKDSLSKNINEDVGSRWSHVFDDQTVRYQGMNGFNDEGAAILYFNICSAINDFCSTAHKNFLQSKIDEKFKDVRRINGNF